MMVQNPAANPLGIEAFYRSFVAALPGNSLLLLPDAPRFTIVAVTEEHLRVIVKDNDSPVGKGILEAYPFYLHQIGNGETNQLGISLEQAMRNKKPVDLPSFRHDLMDEKGRLVEKHWQTSTRPVLSESGEVLYILQTAEDVTARVKTTELTEQIKGMEQAYTLLLQTPIPVQVFKGSSLVMEMANQYALDFWGKNHGIIGKTLAEALPEMQDTSFPSLLHDVMQTGEPYYIYETPVSIRANETVRPGYYNFIYQPYYEDHQLSPAGVIVLGFDVTQKVLAEERSKEDLYRAHTRITNILENTNDAFYSVDASFNFTYVNKRAAELWRRDREQLIGRHYWKEFPAAIGSHSYEKHLEALKEETPVHYQTISPIVGAWIDVSIYPGGDGGLSVFFRDITERKEQEEALEQKVKERTADLERLNHELQRSNSNLEEFAYAASHDLKEPIRKIHFFINQLKSQLDGQLKGMGLHSFHRIEIAAQRMGNLIDDLLHYSHINHRPERKETVDLNNVIHHVLEDLEISIQEKSAVINMGNLPVIQGSCRQLQQMFQNLISNALKYSRKDVPVCIDITIHKAIEDESRYYVICVTDNGIGFEQQYAEKIFQMFARLHARAEYAGTGIGLSIVKKVVDNHNGFIRALSTPGLGATFEIWFPQENFF